MALFSEVVETKMYYLRGRLTRLIKYTMGEPKELIKHSIQLPHDRGYQTAVTLLVKTYGNPHKILSSYRREVKDWPQIKFGDAKAFRKFYNFLLKCESISGSQNWNAMDTPEMLCMLIAKLPGGLIDRWNRNVQAIRKRHLREPDLQDLINFVEEETVLMNDPLFSREALHESIKHPERSTHLKARKRKNCYTKADQKTVEQTVTVASIKCKFCDGNHDLDDCQFYREITVDDRSSFLKKNRLCYGCYAEISSKHTARSSKNRRVCEVCQGRHPTGLHGYKTKNKKSPNEAKADNKNETAMKSNCAGIGNAATNLGEVIRMYVMSVQLRHCTSDKEVSTFALLDTCSQETFVTDDLLKKLGLSGARSLINIKTLNDNKKVKLSLIGLMVSKQPLSEDKRIKWVKLPKLYSREHIPVDSAEIATLEK